MKYKRILLKLSGEALMGDRQYGIDPKRLAEYAQEIKEIHDKGIEIAMKAAKALATAGTSLTVDAAMEIAKTAATSAIKSGAGETTHVHASTCLLCKWSQFSKISR